MTRAAALLAVASAVATPGAGCGRDATGPGEVVPGHVSPSEAAARLGDCAGQARAYAAAAREAPRACAADGECDCAVSSLLASVAAPGMIVVARAAADALTDRARRFEERGCRRDFQMAASVCRAACVQGRCGER